MSTFDGTIREFPGIRIDFFRNLQADPALLCFLSHVHSDHLAGLESLRSPFVYCSAATREILLRLERYPCRINYAQGIIEARQQTYKHLAKILKPLPLDTPILLELGPHEQIQVTLIDANHCIGAAMFLIENGQSAILYTGDVRAEPWWVNSIAAKPCMVPYTHGLRTLDRVYLDTSNLDNIHLQTKAEGLSELLKQVVKYPEDTIFCMQAWTYGYEEVWTQLSRTLNSKIHVDRYKWNIYKSLAGKPDTTKSFKQTYHSKEAPSLAGCTVGNHEQQGCLTLDNSVRIHSCEKGTPCSTMQDKPVVWLKPIVAHLDDGKDLLEVGVGGGGDDLNTEAEIPNLSAEDTAQFIQLASEELDLGKHVQEDLELMLEKTKSSLRDLSLHLDITTFGDDLHTNLSDAIKAVISKVKGAQEATVIQSPAREQTENKNGYLPPSSSTAGLSTRVRFPYARHSSLPELRLLVAAFKPHDVWPCTVDLRDWHGKGITMQGLFGDCCSGAKKTFDHDILMEEAWQSQFEKLVHEDDIDLRDDESEQRLRSSQPQQASLPTNASQLLYGTSGSRPQSTVMPTLRSSLRPLDAPDHEHQLSPPVNLSSPQHDTPNAQNSLPQEPLIPGPRPSTLEAPQTELPPLQTYTIPPGSILIELSSDPSKEPSQELSKNNSQDSYQDSSQDLGYSPFQRREGLSSPVRPLETTSYKRDFEAYRATAYPNNESDQGAQLEQNATPGSSSSRRRTTPQMSLEDDTYVPNDDSQASELSFNAFETRARAFQIAQESIFGDGVWSSRSGVGLISTTEGHTSDEVDLSADLGKGRQ